MIMVAKANPTVRETKLPLPLVGRGKVRDIYAVGEEHLLIVTSDRLSAFDVVLPNPIPDKGRVLNQISAFWFERLSDTVGHHMITVEVGKMGLPGNVLGPFGAQLEGRSMLVRRAKPLAIECVVRGYVAGSGWKDYQKTGSVCGHPLPKGLRQCEKLPEPIFTPATKAVTGHDENIDFEEAARRVGREVAERVRDLSIHLYKRGAEYAAGRGILIADTKFEFGLPLTPTHSPKGRGEGEGLLFIDEALTPDSSRFWPKERYEAGHDQPSYDKQIVRNYLLEIKWDQKPPAPELPREIVEKTSRAYREVYERLVGKKLI